MGGDEIQGSKQEEYEHSPTVLDFQPKAASDTFQHSTPPNNAHGIKRWFRNLRTDKPKWTDVAIVFLTVGIVFLGLMQWMEMHQGGKDTHDLAVQAKAQAENTKTLAEAAAKQATAASEQVQKLQAGVDETHRLATAAQQTADVNRAALESVQRAFIIFRKQMQDDYVVDPRDPNKIMSWEFRPVMENSGTTPTRGARQHANYLPVAVNVDFPPKQFTFPDFVNATPNIEVPFGLGPKEVATGALTVVPPEEVTKIKNREENLFFWGWATYRDVFPNTPLHITMFCIEIQDVRGDLTPASQHVIASSLCNSHNCEDDECKGEPYGTPTRIWH